MAGRTDSPDRPGRAPARSGAGIVVAVAAITLTGLLLRLPSFDDSLFQDELSTYFIATGHDLGQVLHWVRSDLEVSPPLFFILAWATHSLGDPSEALRIVPLVAGVAAIPLTYLVGAWTVGRRAALFGAALVALSPFLILYSTQARAYMLVLLLDLLATLTLLRALEGRRLGWWIAYAACSCAAVYAHYTAVFVLAGLFLWAFVARPKARRALIIANLCAMAGFVPWLPGFIEDRHGPNLIGFIEPFRPAGVGRTLVRWSIGHSFIRIGALPGTVAGASAVAGIAAGLAGLGVRARRRPLRRPQAGTALVLVLALSAPVLAALYSAFGSSVFNAQNLIGSWPGLALAAGVLVTNAGRLAALPAVLILAAPAIGAAKMLGADYQRPDYKAAVRYIDHAGKPGDPIVEAPFTINPISPLDAALGYGRASADPHPVLRLGAPTRSTSLRAIAAGRSLAAPLPAPSTDAIARRAASLGRSRTLFLVVPGSAPLRTLRRLTISPVSRFLKRLPHGYRHVATRTFPGYQIQLGALGRFQLTVSVYVFRGGHHPRGGQ